jgi:hypothetical protein
MPIAAICGGWPALPPGTRLVAPESFALRLVLAESRRATVLVSLVPEYVSLVEFLAMFVVTIEEGGFVPFCADTEGGALVPAFTDSRLAGEFVAAPAIWTLA